MTYLRGNYICIFVVLVLDSCSLRLSCSMREPETKFMCEYFFREIVYAKKNELDRETETE